MCGPLFLALFVEFFRFVTSDIILLLCLNGKGPATDEVSWTLRFVPSDILLSYV